MDVDYCDSTNMILYDKGCIQDMIMDPSIY